MKLSDVQKRFQAPFPAQEVTWKPASFNRERTHTCMSCFGTFTSSRAAHACHGGSACPLGEPDMWESYEPDPVADWEEWRPQGEEWPHTGAAHDDSPFMTMDDPL